MGDIDVERDDEAVAHMPASHTVTVAEAEEAPADIVVHDGDVLCGGNAWPANAKAQRIYNERKGT